MRISKLYLVVSVTHKPWLTTVLNARVEVLNKFSFEDLAQPGVTPE